MSTNQNQFYGAGGYSAGQYSSAPIGALPLGYYLNLVTSQYRQAPNFNAWLQAVLGIFQDAAQCLATFTTAFDLDNAVGVQLDVLGVVVGITRILPFQPTSTADSPVLNDVNYRILLRAQIAKNQWDGTIDGLQGVWQTLFPGGTIAIADGMNMTCSILIYGAFTSLQTDMITHGLIVPRPEGVGYTYTFIGTPPVFGFDENNSLIAGFDTGHFI